MGELNVIAAFVMPLALVAAIWLRRWGPLWLRLLVTGLLPLAYIWHWYGLRAQQGWPIDDPLPDRFQLIAADIVESHQAGGGAGRIHLWLRSEEDGPPRAYGLPYTRELHKMLHEARKKNQAGHRQVGVLRGDDGTGQGASVGGGRMLEFEDAPRSELPPKR